MQKTAIVADASLIYRKVLDMLLSALGFTVVATASHISEVDNLVKSLKPDLLLVDINLSDNGVPGLSVLKPHKDLFPEFKILVLGLHEENDDITKAVIEAGCDGYWNKADNKAGFIEKLNTLFSPAKSKSV